MLWRKIFYRPILWSGYQIKVRLKEEIILLVNHVIYCGNQKTVKIKLHFYLAWGDQGALFGYLERP